MSELGSGPSTVIGNSMGAAAAVLAATTTPEAIDRLILIGPFLRDHGSKAQRQLMQILLSRPWGPAIWAAYYRSLFGDIRPQDHQEHIREALRLLRRPHRWQAFRKTAASSHAAAQRALPSVQAASLVLMGEKDRDFTDPAAEAQWAAESLRGRYQMIPAAGHYPMGEQPADVFDVVLAFLGQGLR